MTNNLAQKMIVIAGAQKAGSTLLHKCLREHPQVYMPSGENRVFTEERYSPEEAERMKADLQQRGRDCSLIGLKCPDYLADIAVLDRLQTHFPDAVVLLSLREPVARAVSAYFWYVKEGHLPVEPLNAGMRRIIQRWRDRSATAAERSIIEYGFYARHIESYLGFLGGDRLQIVFFKDLINHTEEVSRRIYKRLGIDEYYVPRAAGSHPKPGIFSQQRLAWYSIRNRLRRQIRTVIPRPLRRPLVRPLGASFRVVDMLAIKPFVKQVKPKLSDDIHSDMKEIYRDDIARLRELIDMDEDRSSAWLESTP